jgi:hypothetical protein
VGFVSTIEGRQLSLRFEPYSLYSPKYQEVFHASATRVAQSRSLGGRRR